MFGPLCGSLGVLNVPAIASQPDPDANALFAGIEAAGDTVPSGWKAAYTTFVQAAKAHGYWNRFGLFAPLLSSGLTGALVCHRDGAIATMTNHGFVAGDYTTTQGLQGDGHTKYIDTGRLDSANAITDYSLGFVQSLPTPTGANGVGMGTLSDSGGGALLRSEYVGDAYNAYIGQPIGQYFGIPAGLSCATRTGSTITEYQNGSPVASNGVTGSVLLGVNTYLFCFNHGDGNPVIFSNAAHRLFFVGSALTASQMAAFYADLQVFLSAVGRPALP